MTQTRAIIADDEEQLRIHLKSQLSDLWPELVICGEAGNGKEALELIESYRPEVAFLDIKMPGLSGMEVAKRIARTCRVVFITAYDKYAVEAFDNEAIDYLLKPVTIERLSKAVKRLQREIAASSKPPSELSEMVERVIARVYEKGTSGYLRWIRAQHGDGVRLVPVDDVYYFQASDKYTLVLTKGEELLIRKAIKELEDELDPSQFWRIHRGTIVNARCIAQVSRSLTGRGVVKLKDRSELLTVSRRYIHAFRQM
jgi:DNA-binding LytR/AlgR family response regulator